MEINTIQNNHKISDWDLRSSIEVYKKRLNKTGLIDKKTLNRRKKKLDEMLSTNNNYFSEESIMQRDPVLYEIYVGNHKRKNQIFNKKMNFLNSGCSVNNFLYEEMERDVHSEILQEELKKEESLYGSRKIKELYAELDNVNSKANNMLEDEEDELIRLMALRFLLGDDKDFINYEEIDNNELYDDIVEMNKDLEEDYFDKEEEGNNNNNDDYTGILDY